MHLKEIHRFKEVSVRAETEVLKALRSGEHPADPVYLAQQDASLSRGWCGGAVLQHGALELHTGH